MQARLEPLGGALQLTELRNLLDVVVEQAVSGLRDLAAHLPSKADDARKQELLAYLHATRQRLLRLHVLAQWGNMAPAAAAVSRVLDAAARQGDAARDAADQLAMAHTHITAVQAPIHDVPTAAEVLETGGYRSLPAAIEQLRPAPLPPAAERAAALRLMDQMLRARLLQEALPAGLQVLRVRAGVAVLGSAALFEARLTLVPAPDEDAVLARCGASSGAAPSTAPSGTATAPALVGATDHQAAVKAEAGHEAQAGPAAGSGVQQQAADAPAPLALAPGADAAAPDAPGEKLARPRGHEEWRWRLLSFTILPDFKGRPAVAPQSAAALQGQLEARMWAAADAAVLAAAGAVRAGSAQQTAASAQRTSSQRQHSGTPPAGVLKAEPGTPATSQEGTPPAALDAPGSKLGSSAAGELPTPLGLMAAVLKGVATRILVQEAVASLRRLAAVDGSWHGSLRVTEPRLLKVGARAAYWTSSPPACSAAQLAGHPAATAAPTAQPDAAQGGTPAAKLEAGVAVEIGLDAAGDICVVADPPLSSPAGEAEAADAQHPAAEAGAAGGQPAAPAALLTTAHAASAAAAATNVGCGGAMSPVSAEVDGLWLDPASGDAGAPLLAAARATAAVQLAALQRALERAGGLAAAAGTAVLRSDGSAVGSPAEAHQQQQQQGAAGPAAERDRAAEPTLELRCGDAVVLAVGVAPRSGRLTLRLGGAAAAESAYDQGAFTSQEEDRLARQQREAAVRAAASRDGAAQHPALAAAGAAAARLAGLFAVLETRRRLQGLVAAARSLGLRDSSLPRHLLKAYADSHPGVQMLPQRFAVLAFPPTPPLSGFPATQHHQQQQQQQPPAAVTDSTSKPVQQPTGAGSSAGSLRFCLLAAPAQQPAREQADSALPAAGTTAAPAGDWRFWLVAVRTTQHGVPQRVVQLQHIPPQSLLAAADPVAPDTAAVAARIATIPGAVDSEAIAATAHLKAASVSPSKRKRQREAVEDGDADADVRPYKQLRDTANGLPPVGAVTNGLAAGSETTSGTADMGNGKGPAAVPLANGHIADAPSAATPGIATPATNGAAGKAAAAVPAAPPAAAAAAAEPLSPAAALEHAVAWCRGRLTWTSLVLQLQALGLQHSEQLTLGPPGGAVAAEAAAAPQPQLLQPVRSLRVRGLRAVAALDAAGAAEATAAVGQPGLVLLPTGGETGTDRGAAAGGFRAVLCSAYLARQQLQPGSSAALEAGATAAVVSVKGGVSLAYSLSAGDTALTAVADTLRIVRLHTFLQRLQRLTAVGQPGPASAADPSCAGPRACGSALRISFQLPGCGAVQLLRASPFQAVLAVRQSFDGATVASAADGGTAAGTAGTAAGSWLAPAPEMHINVQWLSPGPALPAQQAQQAPDSAGPAAAAAASHPASGRMRCRVSAAVVAPHPAAAAAAAGSTAAGAAAAGAADGASAAVPEAWCAAVAALADAGEEALVLRALALAGPQVAAAAAAASPAAAAAAGWRAGQVALRSVRPPYSAQLHLHRAPGFACHIDLRFAAGQLTWLSMRPGAAAAATAAAAPQSEPVVPKQEGGLPTAAPDAATPALPADFGLTRLFADLAQEHAAVSLPAEGHAATTARMQAVDSVAIQTMPGVWVHGAPALQTVIAAVLVHLAGHMPL